MADTDVTINTQRIETGEKPIHDWLSTGCDLVDLAITGDLPGGFPVGRFCHVIGEHSTGKTVFGFEVLHSAQKKGGIASYVDAEHTFEDNWAEGLFGLEIGENPNEDTTNWQKRHPQTIEELFDTNIKELLEKMPQGKPSAMVVDSLTALPANVEIGKDLTDKTYGTDRAKILSAAFRTYTKKITDAGLTVLFIDQTRDDIGSQYGGTTTSGGKALRFYSSVRVKLSLVEKIKGKYDIITGVRLKANVEKNKVGKPFRFTEFDYYFDYGIDNIGSNILFLKEIFGLKKEYKFRDFETNILIKAIKYIEENNLERELIYDVCKYWKEIYKPIERKLKER